MTAGSVEKRKGEIAIRKNEVFQRIQSLILMFLVLRVLIFNCLDFLNNCLNLEIKISDIICGVTV